VTGGTPECLRKKKRGTQGRERKKKRESEPTNTNYSVKENSLAKIGHKHFHGSRRAGDLEKVKRKSDGTKGGGGGKGRKEKACQLGEGVVALGRQATKPCSKRGNQ